jgi:hypothetical protein
MEDDLIDDTGFELGMPNRVSLMDITRAIQ